MVRKTIKRKTVGIGTGLALTGAAIFGAILLRSSSSFHAQTMPDGKTVKFEHGGSNDWWVQVQVLGDGGTQATSVQVMDTNGPWVSLNKQRWTADGTWGPAPGAPAASMRRP